jgi:BREX protein BrxB
MPSLDEAFQQLVQHLREPGSLSASRSDPFFYLVYDPAEALEVKSRIPVWSAQLRNLGFAVERVSFSELVWELVEASGRWEEWLSVEGEAEIEQVNDAVRSVLGGEYGLIAKVAGIVSQERPATIVLLTETEMLHPYFRVRVLESALHDRIKIPTIVFYPGRRSGQYGLHFLNLYPEDGNYRATVIGG